MYVKLHEALQVNPGFSYSGHLVQRTTATAYSSAAVPFLDLAVGMGPLLPARLLVAGLTLAALLVHGAAAVSSVNVTAFGRVEAASDSATVSVPGLVLADRCMPSDQLLSVTMPPLCRRSLLT